MNIYNNFFKSFLREIAPSFIFSKRSYSQEGEDLVVDRLLSSKKGGFYVEVGAHHPFRFSNTYFFYKRGWTGICIDPLPGTKKAFNKSRPKDIFLQLGISMNSGLLNYFMFNEPALNTFNKCLAEQRNGKEGYRLIKTMYIETKPLTEILRDYKISKEGIDLLSIDVEGMDLEVLSSIDLGKYAPKIIIVECLDFDLNDIKSDSIFSLLTKRGYIFYAKTGNSIIFQLISS
jgi:FkbM family methyltransferase